MSEQADTLARLTRELAHCCMAKESEIFQKFGLSSSEGNALFVVADGATSPSALAAKLGVVRSRITPLVQGLVDKEFLERSESQTDRRVRELKLTPKGEAVADDADQFRLGFHRRLLERFEEHERQHLFATLTQLHGKMLEVGRSLHIDDLKLNMSTLKED